MRPKTAPEHEPGGPLSPAHINKSHHEHAGVEAFQGSDMSASGGTGESEPGWPHLAHVNAHIHGVPLLPIAVPSAVGRRVGKVGHAAAAAATPGAAIGSGQPAAVVSTHGQRHTTEQLSPWPHRPITPSQLPGRGHGVKMRDATPVHWSAAADPLDLQPLPTTSGGDMLPPHPRPRTAHMAAPAQCAGVTWGAEVGPVGGGQRGSGTTAVAAAAAKRLMSARSGRKQLAMDWGAVSVAGVCERMPPARHTHGNGAGSQAGGGVEATVPAAVHPQSLPRRSAVVHVMRGGRDARASWADAAAVHEFWRPSLAAREEVWEGGSSPVGLGPNDAAEWEEWEEGDEGDEGNGKQGSCEAGPQAQVGGSGRMMGLADVRAVVLGPHGASSAPVAGDGGNAKGEGVGREGVAPHVRAPSHDDSAIGGCGHVGSGSAVSLPSLEPVPLPGLWVANSCDLPSSSSCHTRQQGIASHHQRHHHSPRDSTVSELPGVGAARHDSEGAHGAPPGGGSTGGTAGGGRGMGAQISAFRVQYHKLVSSLAGSVRGARAASSPATGGGGGSTGGSGRLVVGAATRVHPAGSAPVAGMAWTSQQQQQQQHQHQHQQLLSSVESGLTAVAAGGRPLSPRATTQRTPNDIALGDQPQGPGLRVPFSALLATRRSGPLLGGQATRRSGQATASAPGGAGAGCGQSGEGGARRSGGGPGGGGGGGGENGGAEALMEKIFGTAYAGGLEEGGEGEEGQELGDGEEEWLFGEAQAQQQARMSRHDSSAAGKEEGVRGSGRGVTEQPAAGGGARGAEENGAAGEGGGAFAPLSLLSPSARARRRKRLAQAGAGAGKAPVRRALLHPYCAFRARWDVAVVGVVLLRCVSCPLLVGFQGLPPRTYWLALEVAGDLVLAVDVALNMLTGFDDGGVVVMDAAAAAARYLGSWGAAVDVVGTLPYAVVPFMFLSASDEVQYLVRLPQLLVLLSLARALRYTRKWQDAWRLNLNALRLLQLLFTALMVAHLHACLSFFLQRQQHFPDGGWVASAGLLEEGSSTTYAYALALLRSVTLVMGAQADASASSSSLELAFTLLAFVAGVLVYTIIVGVMSSIVLSLDRTGSAFVERLQMWKDFCRYRRLSPDLRTRVMAAVGVRYANRRVLDDARLLLDLPPAIRSDVHLHLCAELVACVPVLQAAEPIVVRALVGRLAREGLAPGTAVFRAGDIADCMYFILRGVVRISEPGGGALITSLGRGSHFGEMGLLAYLDGEVGVRSADAYAVGERPVELYKLGCADFELLARYYPEVTAFLRDVAAVRSAFNAMRSTRAPR